MAKIGPFSVRLSSVTIVHQTQAVEIFGNISTTFGTLIILWHAQKTLWRSSHAGLNPRGVAKYSDVWPIKGYISETVQDTRYVSTNHSQEVAYGLSINTKIGDLQWPWTALFLWQLFCVISAKSVAYGAHWVKVV